MSELFKAITTNDTRTENGMPTNSTSSNFCLDFFFTAGAMRTADETRIMSIFNSAFSENPLIAMRLLFWARDVRGGAGERRLFRVIMSNLNNNQILYFINNLKHIPEYGRWDDLLYIYQHTSLLSVKSEIINIIKNGLTNKNQLCAKWLPRKGYIAKLLREELHLNPKQYRKLLVQLTNVVETNMCNKTWQKIEYSHVPSVAMTRYKKAFYKNDIDRFKSYVEALVNGTTKVNASAVYPYDIIKSLKNSNKTEKSLLNVQWDSLPNYLENSEHFRVLPLVDVSGSMDQMIGTSVKAIDVSVSLGLYISERNTGLFKDYFMTFSERPELIHLSGSLSDRYSTLSRSNWGYNTDLISCFDLILSKAIKHDIKEKEMPTHLLIISDMEFDEAAKNNKSAIQVIKKKYKDAGYKMPNIIFWNLVSRGSNVPVKFDQEGTALISGFSPSILKNVLSNKMNPLSIMMDVVESDRYKLITI